MVLVEFIGIGFPWVREARNRQEGSAIWTVGVAAVVLEDPAVKEGSAAAPSIPPGPVVEDDAVAFVMLVEVGMKEGPAGFDLGDPAVKEGQPVTPGPVVEDDAVVFVVLLWLI